MLSQEEIDVIDTDKMYLAYEKWPELAKQYFDNNEDELNLSGIDHFVFAGMGGSGTLGDVFSSIMSKTDIHVSVVKGYHLPETTDENTLVICTSVSGNSVETISILEEVREKNLKSISFHQEAKLESIVNKIICNTDLLKKIIHQELHFQYLCIKCLKC